MDKEAIKERVKFYTELLKLLWIFAIALGGGEVGLLINLNSSIKALLFFGGLFLLLLTVIAIIYVLLTIKDELAKL